MCCGGSEGIKEAISNPSELTAQINYLAIDCFLSAWLLDLVYEMFFSFGQVP